MTQKLYAILVGGHHPKANVEIHDMRFCLGESLEATYDQLRESWWGTPGSLHIDAYAELSALDGHRIEIAEGAPAPNNGPKLYFINVGFYDAAEFGEQHAYRFMVGKTKPEIWKRALDSVENGESLHKDNFLDIDEIIDLSASLSERGVHLNIQADHDAAEHAPVMVSDYIKLPA